MLTNAIMTITAQSGLARARFFKWVYSALPTLTRELKTWTLMNYGFTDLAQAENPLFLEAGDEPERYSFQLYHHAVALVDLQDKDVLDISCGRGGGTAFLRRYLKAKAVTGLDLSEEQIEFCNLVHRLPGLRFVQGMAENLPFADKSFDVAVNIEASCLYRDAARFIAETRRILKPGGYLAYADIHRRKDVVGLFDMLERSGMEVISSRDITRNVIRALELDDRRRQEGIKAQAPFFLRGLLRAFAGTKGTRIPRRLADGRLVYLSILLRKPNNSTSLGE